jgi:hypothetical protein
MKEPSFATIALKTTMVHTVTYFVVGAVAFTLLNYSSRYANPIVANVLRQTDHPLIAAGPLFQVLRGFLFGIVFYTLREIIFPRKRGWLTLWLMLVIVGILSPFGAAPSSIEGMLYTVLPMWFHIMSLPEILIQSFLLAFLVHYWVNYTQKKWLGWAFGIVFAVVVLLSTMGILAGLGILPAPP